MTIEEAKQALKKGEAITHNYFTNDEFVYMKNGNLLDESDYILNWDLFWRDRDNELFFDGWSIKSLTK